jgi:tetratricopeptide (TPR) repeat protein
LFPCIRHAERSVLLASAWCRSAELALSEANLLDPEHPGVWGYLALLLLLQGREADASQTLTQAQRHGLASSALHVELGDAYQQRGLFSTAAALLGKAVAAQDSVQGRCKLAAVLLAECDHQGCQQQLAAAAELPATEAEQQLLMSVLQRLQVAWPHL